MGAVYSVSLDLTFSAPGYVISATHSFVDNYGSRAVFSNVDYSSIRKAVEIILPERGMIVKEDSIGRFVCECDFEASYGWESVMTDWFNYISQAQAICNDSSIKIWPDEGWILGVTYNSGVRWKTDNDSEWYRTASGVTVPPVEAVETRKYISDDPEIQHVLDVINEYLIDEFGVVVEDSDGLTDIGLMYTTAGDNNEYELQVSANILEPSVSYYIDGELVNKLDFFDAEALAEYISDMNFDSYYNACVNLIDWGDEE